MLFLDGVGIGSRDHLVNPFFAARLPTLRRLLDGDLPSLDRPRHTGRLATVLPLDATLGVPGLPQSGTGQMALLTGINGAQRIGRHFGPHPYSTLRPAIDAHNVFQRVVQANGRAAFANAFPQRFFDFVEHRKTRLSVVTLSCLSAGVPLRRAEDLARGNGVSADLTGEAWRAHGHPEIPVITPQEAGYRLADMSAMSTFTLFDYWKTDHAGHAQGHPEAVQVLERLDGLLEGVLARLDLDETLLVITSDHGNIEDLSTRSHTRNPVPLILVTTRHRDVARRIERQGGVPDLTHVLPVLLEAMHADGESRLGRRSL
jgi:2,3-bisphosphoglycerate-independent phosphoglycerate mutase